MFRRILLGVVFVTAFAGAADVFAETVELTAFYPTPKARYKNLNSTSATCLATTAGQNAYIGYTQASVTADAALGSPVLQHVPVVDDGRSDLFLSGSIAQEAWQDVNFLNGWSNNLWGHNYAHYFRDKSGIVHLQGLVVRVAGAFGITNFIFNLPVGYRPARRERFIVGTYGDAPPQPNTSACLCYFASNGNVIGMTGSNSCFSLDGITFSAVGYQDA